MRTVAAIDRAAHGVLDHRVDRVDGELTARSPARADLSAQLAAQVLDQGGDIARGEAAGGRRCERDRLEHRREVVDGDFARGRARAATSVSTPQRDDRAGPPRARAPARSRRSARRARRRDRRRADRGRAPASAAGSAVAQRGDVTGGRTTRPAWRRARARLRRSPSCAIDARSRTVGSGRRCVRASSARTSASAVCSCERRGEHLRVQRQGTAGARGAGRARSCAPGSSAAAAAAAAGGARRCSARGRGDAGRARGTAASGRPGTSASAISSTAAATSARG